MASAMLKARFEMDASSMLAALAAMEARMRRALMQLGQIMAQRIEAAAKAGAPWNDRTGNARQGLTAMAVMEGSRLVIYLFHVMSYGLWLEVAMQTRYAIIMQTLQAQYPAVVAMASRLIMGG